MKKPRLHLFVCRNYREPENQKPSCRANGSDDVIAAFVREFEKRNLFEEIQLTKTQCLGYCYSGPMAVVYPEGVWYAKLKPEDVPRIVEEHLIGGKVVEEKVMRE
jgi:(2Fe-2S) ferredoxin